MTQELIVSAMSVDECDALVRAHRFLEHPSLAARLTSVVGAPIEMGLELLPKGWTSQVHRATRKALEQALGTAIRSLREENEHRARRRGHMAAGMLTGAVGGFFGLPGLLVELPLTTTLILRSVADIAKQHGEDVTDPDCQLSCIEVFAYGARSSNDDAAETGYYGVRIALAMSVSNASGYLARHGFAGEAPPLLVHLISGIASRFGASVSEKAAAQLMPVVGAVGGAAINAIFIQHFQDIAEGHFTVRRLERRYGKALVRAEYERLTAAESGEAREAA